MEKIIRGVKMFQEHIFPKQREFFRKISKEQRPNALFITCSDSRVHPNLITQTDAGELFILRNPGNIVPAYYPIPNSEDATIEYAVEVLRVPHIIVCGHSDCGAMRALLHKSELGNLPAVSSWLQYAESTLRVVRMCCSDGTEEEQLTSAIEKNVLIQLDNLKTHPSVAARTTAGELELHAWVYDIGQGTVNHFDAREGRFVPLVPAAETVTA